MVQDIFTATKVLALLIIIISGLAWLGLGNIRFVLCLHFQFLQWSKIRKKVKFWEVGLIASKDNNQHFLKFFQAIDGAGGVPKSGTIYSWRQKKS